MSTNCYFDIKIYSYSCSSKNRKCEPWNVKESPCKTIFEYISSAEEEEEKEEESKKGTKEQVKEQKQEKRENQGLDGNVLEELTGITVDGCSEESISHGK